MRIFGDVQRVGYRFVVQDLARRMGVKGYVKNLPDGSVEIVAEASKEVIDKFVGAVHPNYYPRTKSIPKNQKILEKTAVLRLISQK